MPGFVAKNRLNYVLLFRLMFPLRALLRLRAFCASTRDGRKPHTGHIECGGQNTRPNRHHGECGFFVPVACSVAVAAAAVAMNSTLAPKHTHTAYTMHITYPTEPSQMRAHFDCFGLFRMAVLWLVKHKRCLERTQPTTATAHNFRVSLSRFFAN